MANAESIKFSTMLHQIYGDNVNTRFKLEGSQALIGRSHSSFIKLDNPNVSRKHCILNCADNGWTVTDNHSQNGTWVCGTKLEPDEPHLLEIGDIIFLGPPAQMPQAFCVEINYIFDDEPEPIMIQSLKQKSNLTSKKSVDEVLLDNQKFFEEMERTKREIKILTGEINELRNESCHLYGESISNQKTPETEISHMSIDDSVILISPEKKHPVIETHLSDDKDLVKISLSSTSHTQKRKLSVSSQSEQISSSSNVECKKLKVVEDVATDLSLSNKLNEMDSSDQIPEVSSTENDQPEISQSLLDVGDDIDIIQQSCQSTENSEKELLKGKLKSMSEEIKKLQRSRSFLKQKFEHEFKKNYHKLKKKDDEQKKLEEDLQKCALKAQNEIKKEIMEKFEEDLICNICTELLIKPTVLECSHTFCEFCINSWKKKKNECPMCRCKIQTMTRVLTLEHLINKTLETLTPDQRDKRNELIKQRCQEEKLPRKAKKSPRSHRYSHRRHIRRPVNRNTPIPGNFEISDRRNFIFPNHRIPYSLSIDNSSYIVPEVLISDNEGDTINIYIS